MVREALWSGGAESSRLAGLRTRAPAHPPTPHPLQFSDSGGGDRRPQCMSAAQLAPPDDALLVRAVLAGDVDAYGALVDRYSAEYMRFAVRMLGTVEDADEVLHTAFYRAYQ